MDHAKMVDSKESSEIIGEPPPSGAVFLSVE